MIIKTINITKKQLGIIYIMMEVHNTMHEVVFIGTIIEHTGTSIYKTIGEM